MYIWYLYTYSKMISVLILNIPGLEATCITSAAFYQQKEPTAWPYQVPGRREHLPHWHHEEKKGGFDQPIALSSRGFLRLIQPIDAYIRHMS